MHGRVYSALPLPLAERRSTGAAESTADDLPIGSAGAPPGPKPALMSCTASLNARARPLMPFAALSVDLYVRW